MGIFGLAGCVALGIWISFCGALGSAAGFLALVAVISFSVSFSVSGVSGSGAILYGGLMTCGLSNEMFPCCGLSITLGCSLVIIRSFLFLLHNLPISCFDGVCHRTDSGSWAQTNLLKLS